MTTIRSSTTPNPFAAMGQVIRAQAQAAENAATRDAAERLRRSAPLRRGKQTRGPAVARPR